MQDVFQVSQKTFNLTECEDLCGRGSTQIKSLSAEYYCGSQSGGGISLPLSRAIDTKIRAIVASNGMEVHSSISWLPSLRSEVLMHLGENILNWEYQGAKDAEKQFWSKFYGDKNAVRSRIAPLVGSFSLETVRQVRFFSQSDVEVMSDSQYELAGHDRIPRFVIDAHHVSTRIRAISGGALFFVTG